MPTKKKRQDLFSRKVHGDWFFIPIKKKRQDLFSIQVHGALRGSLQELAMRHDYMYAEKPSISRLINAIARREIILKESSSRRRAGYHNTKKKHQDLFSIQVYAALRGSLQELAIQFGCLYGGKPSIVKLIEAIARREIILKKSPKI